MFYSHEVLTSRKHGVATVWLVATLGAKPSHKRIDRKQILEVDVRKACQTIIDPGAPLALRLQGSLLYGLSSVYLRQANYVLSDAQYVQNNMRMMLRSIENLALDPEASKARPEQLVLQDDPSFLPEFLLPPLDLLADLETDPSLRIVRSGDSQSLTPFASQQWQASSEVGELGGLILPSSSSPIAATTFKLPGADEVINSSGFGGVDNGFQLDEDPGFTFNDHGELELTEPKPAPKTPRAVSRAPMMHDAATELTVREQQAEVLDDGTQIPGDPMHVNVAALDDDIPAAPDSANIEPQQNSGGSEEVLLSTSTASAPMRQKRRRAVSTLPVDTRMELRNKDLADWNANYINNMDKAIREKNDSRMKNQAKKAAERIMWGGGLGDIGHQFKGIPVPKDFDLFIGDTFFELVTGNSRKKTAGMKHDRDSGIDEGTQEESRNVRQKTHEVEEAIGRGVDEGFFMHDDEVELPREAPSPLDDSQLFSTMPWNITASIRGSSAVPRSALGRSDQGRPGSRLVSASPLHGHGQAPTLKSVEDQNLDSDVDFKGVDFGGYAERSSPPTEIADGLQISNRVREALSTEGGNFLLFVADSITEKRRRAQISFEAVHDSLQLDAAGDIDEVTFEQLLPPAENSRMVASQGLMMVLGLGCKGMLDIQQPDHFGDISIKLTAEPKIAKVVQISDSGDSDDDTASQNISSAQEQRSDIHYGNEEDEFQIPGHFEEQIAAGLAGAEGYDDMDELYD